jgi:hypothetical protein
MPIASMTVTVELSTSAAAWICNPAGFQTGLCVDVCLCRT